MMNNNLRKNMIRYFCSVFMVTLSVVAAICPVSCRLTEEGIEILPGDKNCPQIDSFEVTGKNSVFFCCSEKIILSDVELYEICTNENELLEEKIENIFYDETGKNVEVQFEVPMEVGKSYMVSGVFSDLSGNTVDFEQEFTGYNANPAVLLINEICFKYDKNKNISDFVEFYVLKGGNTYGYVLSGAQKGSEYDYYFPSMEVSDGEYIVLHGKTLQPELAVNETGDELSLSQAEGSFDGARDLWRSGEVNSMTGNDVLVLKNNCNHRIYGGILLSESGKSGWSKNLQKEYSSLLSENAVWSGGSDVVSAFYTDNATTIYRSVSRINLEDVIEAYKSNPEMILVSSRDDWKLTEKTKNGSLTVSGATPGFKNSIVFYGQ